MAISPSGHAALPCNGRERPMCINASSKNSTGSSGEAKRFAPKGRRSRRATSGGEPLGSPLRLALHAPEPLHTYLPKPVPSMKAALPLVAARCNAFRSRYSSDAYRRCACSRLGDSMSTGKTGCHSPSTTLHRPPTVRERPPYRSTVARAPSLYLANLSGSVTSKTSKKQYAQAYAVSVKQCRDFPVGVCLD
jgi:hypothetical protein